MADKSVNIELSISESLVLFEFLQRYFQDDQPLQIIDKSEEAVLSMIAGVLEKTLVEPFASDYLVRVDAARSELRLKWVGNESP